MTHIFPRSFCRSGDWAQHGWIFCLGSHWAEIEVSARAEFLVTVGLRSPGAMQLVWAVPCPVACIDVCFLLGQVRHISLTSSPRPAIENFIFVGFLWLGQAHLDNCPIIIKSTDLGLHVHLQNPFTAVPRSVLLNDPRWCMYTRDQASRRAFVGFCYSKVTGSLVSKGNVVLEVLTQDNCFFEVEGVFFIQPAFLRVLLDCTNTTLGVFGCCVREIKLNTDTALSLKCQMLKVTW